MRGTLTLTLIRQNFDELRVAHVQSEPKRMAALDGLSGCLVFPPISRKFMKIVGLQQDDSLTVRS